MVVIRGSYAQGLPQTYRGPSSNVWSRLAAVVERFASAEESILLMSPAEQKPDQAGLAYSSLAKTVTEDFMQAILAHTPHTMSPVRKAYSTDAQWIQ